MFRKKYSDEFFKQIVQSQFFNKYLKPKPRWCPKFLWRLLIKLVFNINSVQNGNNTGKN